MIIYTGRTDINKGEHLVQEENQVVTHLVLPKGESLAKHHVNKTVVVVPIKGRVNFSDEHTTEEIYPGKIVRMQPDEVHSLDALEDAELMVIKSDLA